MPLIYDAAKRYAEAKGRFATVFAEMFKFKMRKDGAILKDSLTIISLIALEERWTAAPHLFESHVVDYL